MATKKTPHFLKRWGDHFAKKPLHANITALVLALTPLIGLPLDWLSRVLLIFITLANGYRAGLITTVWCLLPAIALGITVNIAILISIGSVMLLTWAGGAMRRYFRAAFPTVESMTLLGCLIVMGFHIAIPDTTQWWTQLLNQYGNALLQTLHISKEQQALFQSTLLPLLAQYATGLNVMSVLLSVLFNLWIASAWYHYVYPKNPLQKQQRWRVSRTMACLLLLAVGLGGLANWPFLRDMLPVLSIPFILSGVYLMYTWVTSYWQAGLILAAFLIACLYCPYLLSAIILAAWINSWYTLTVKKRE